MVDEFLKRKHGEVDVTYPLPSLEGCLKDTYGVIVYQEQVMQIAQIVAGVYPRAAQTCSGERWGRKTPKPWPKNEPFSWTVPSRMAPVRKRRREIFDLMEKFAEYGFNKSHSAAYALISYHTAYLKTHHKVESWPALLTSKRQSG